MSDGSDSTTTENNKGLPSREVDVLQLIVKGIMNKEIVDKLDISLNTVLTYRKNVTAKLGIKIVSGLTLHAIVDGVIPGDDIGLWRNQQTSFQNHYIQRLTTLFLYRFFVIKKIY